MHTIAHAMPGPSLKDRCPPKCSRPWLASCLFISLFNITEGRQIFRSRIAGEGLGFPSLRGSQVRLLRGASAESSASNFRNSQVFSLDRGRTINDAFNNTSSGNNIEKYLAPTPNAAGRAHPSCEEKQALGIPESYYQIFSSPFRPPFTPGLRLPLRPGLNGVDAPCLCFPPPSWDYREIRPDEMNNDPSQEQVAWFPLLNKLDEYTKPNPDAMPVCELFYSTIDVDPDYQGPVSEQCRSACLAAVLDMQSESRYLNWLYQYWTYPTQNMDPSLQTEFNGLFDYVASRMIDSNCAATCQSISNPYQEVACFIPLDACETVEVTTTSTEGETTATTEETTTSTSTSTEGTTFSTTIEIEFSTTVGLDTAGTTEPPPQTSEGIPESTEPESVNVGNIVVGSVAAGGAACIAAGCTCGLRCGEITGMRDFGVQLVGGADDLDRAVRHEKVNRSEKLQNRAFLQEGLASRINVALTMSQGPTTIGGRARPGLTFTETSASVPSTIFADDDPGAARDENVPNPAGPQPDSTSQGASRQLPSGISSNAPGPSTTSDITSEDPRRISVHRYLA